MSSSFFWWPRFLIWYTTTSRSDDDDDDDEDCAKVRAFVERKHHRIEAERGALLEQTQSGKESDDHGQYGVGGTTTNRRRDAVRSLFSTHARERAHTRTDDLPSNPLTDSSASGGDKRRQNNHNHNAHSNPSGAGSAAVVLTSRKIGAPALDHSDEQGGRDEPGPEVSHIKTPTLPLSICFSSTRILFRFSKQ